MKKSNDFDSMNPEEFEQQLGRLPIRPLPPEWRAEILHEARAAAPSPSRESFAVTLWRELFWSCRRVWAGLAAIWIALLVIGSATSDSRPTVAASAPQKRDWKMALQAQRQLTRQLLEQDSTPAAVAVPGRRSELHDFAHIG